MTELTKIKIRYAPGEWGWAEDLGNNRARIANIPLEDALNIDDVVELIGDADQPRRAGKVIESRYPHKTIFRYSPPQAETYSKLRAAYLAKDCKIEGFGGGIAAVAHFEAVDVVAVAREAGVEIEEMD